MILSISDSVIFVRSKVLFTGGLVAEEDFHVGEEVVAFDLGSFQGWLAFLGDEFFGDVDAAEEGCYVWGQG